MSSVYQYKYTRSQAEKEATEFRKYTRALIREVKEAKDPGAKAQAYLEKAGIVDKTGRLTAHYR